MTPGENPNVVTPARRLADYLSEYAHSVVEEWMRIVEIDGNTIEPGSRWQQARATWMGDGTFSLGECPYGEEFGHFRLTVRVDPIEVPPVGPECDPALQVEMEAFDPEARRNADKRHPCLECLDPNEDPRSWCDCGGDTDRFGECAYPCVSRAHQPEDCRNAPPRWVPTEWQYVASGDRVRLGTSEAEVTQATRFDGHTKVDSWRDRNTGRMRDNVTGRWDHIEIRIRLAHLPNVLEFPPAGPVEVLMDAGRRAEHIVRVNLGGETIGRE